MVFSLLCPNCFLDCSYGFLNCSYGFLDLSNGFLDFSCGCLDLSYGFSICQMVFLIAHMVYSMCHMVFSLFHMAFLICQIVFDVSNGFSSFHFVVYVSIWCARLFICFSLFVIWFSCFTWCSRDKLFSLCFQYGVLDLSCSVLDCSVGFLIV